VAPFSSLVATSRYSLPFTPPLLRSRGENPNFVGRRRCHERRVLLGGAAVGTFRGVRMLPSCSWVVAVLLRDTVFLHQRPSPRLRLCVGEPLAGGMASLGELGLRVLGLCSCPRFRLGSCFVLCSRGVSPLPAVRRPFEPGRGGRDPLRQWRSTDRRQIDQGASGSPLLRFRCFYLASPPSLTGASFSLEDIEDFSWVSCFCVCCSFGCCKLFSAFLYHQPFGLY
jgi:hypothetical protein